MTRISRFRTVCRSVFLLLMIILLVRLAAALVPPLNPLAGEPIWGCDLCELRQDVVRLTPPEVERQALDRLFVARLAMPGVSSMMRAAQAVQLLPFVAVFFCLAMAFRSMAAGGLTRPALRWLRRSALATTLLILADPISQSIRWTAFSPVIHGREHMIVSAEPARMLWLILLWGGMWAFVWILEEAVMLRRDLEEYV